MILYFSHTLEGFGVLGTCIFSQFLYLHVSIKKLFCSRRIRDIIICVPYEDI